jgi:hypothetical protein
MKALDPRKPIFVFETATVGTQVDKDNWLWHALKSSQEWNIKGIIWFQVNKEKNWKLDTSSDYRELRQATSSSGSWVLKKNGL